MKDQLIAVLEAMRLSQAALAKDTERGGPPAEMTVKALRRLVLEPHVVSAMEALYPNVDSPQISPDDAPLVSRPDWRAPMSEEALWRENYWNLVGAVGMIREAAEEAFGPLAPLPNTERTGSTAEECEHVAQAIVTYAEKMRRRIVELEGQLALTSRMNIQGVTETEDAPSIASD